MQPFLWGAYDAQETWRFPDATTDSYKDELEKHLRVWRFERYTHLSDKERSKGKKTQHKARGNGGLAHQLLQERHGQLIGMGTLRILSAKQRTLLRMW